MCHHKFVRVLILTLCKIYLHFSVDVRIFSFNLIVSIDYLLKISNFFVGADAKPKPTAQVPSKNTGQSASSSAPSRTALAVSLPESARDLEKHSQTVMTINLKLEKPDILLVEAMDDLDTNALVLNVRLLVHLVLLSAYNILLLIYFYFLHPV